MADPTQPTLTDGEATTLAALGVDNVFGTKINYVKHDTGPDSSPQKGATQQTQFQEQVLRQLGPVNQGAVRDEGGLNVGIHAIVYEIANIKKTYAGETSKAMTDAATNYVYLDGTSGVSAQVSTSAFPDDVFMLAEVVCAAGDISSIQDARMRNAQIGITGAWSTAVATQDVDLDNHGLIDLKSLDFTSSTELTIASGSITPTQFLHTVDTEGETGTDLLDNITATAGKRSLLLLYPAAVGRVVTIRDNSISGGNIYLTEKPDTAILLSFDTDNYYILLLQDTDTTWREIMRSSRFIADMTEDLLMNGFGLYTIGLLGLNYPNATTIATGSFVYPQCLAIVETEGLAATDDLDTVTSGEAGWFLLLVPYNDAHTVVVKHAIGAGKFKLANGLDFAMDTLEHSLLCRHNGTQWLEVARSPWQPAMLRIASDKTTNAVPYPLTVHVPGALVSATAYEWVFLANHAFTIRNLAGVVLVAPSATPCVVDVQADTGGGFSSIIGGPDSDKIYIAAGTYYDTTGDIWYEVAAGTWLRVYVVTASSAEDLTVMINGQTPMVTPYVAP